MTRYLARRLLLAIPTLLLVLIATFLMIRLAPGDPAQAFLEETSATEERLRVVRRQLGLDRPLPVQLAYYAVRVVRGNLGHSYFSHQPVLTMIMTRLPFTLELAAAATLLSIALGIPLGILAALRRGRGVDMLISTVAVVTYSMPRFWVGLLLILLFALRLQWFPVIGAGGTTIGSRLYHLMLPMLAIGLSRVALLTRITRSTMLDVLRQDFIRTARSKGVGERAVLSRHALRNTLIPILTVVGLGLGHLIGGSIIAEAVFVRPGLGTLLIEGIRARDYPVVQGSLLFFAVGIVAMNILVDALYALVDPRIRYS
jgi:ABC-type dipeptide/oligopeptide/nickel transport system permease component